MGEVVNVLVAVAVVVFIVRWATSSKDAPAGQSPASILGFRPKTVTPEMVETIHNMFPDIPSDNVQYDLLRTGSVQRTSNTILEKGFLPPPPQAYYTIYPRAIDPTPRGDAPQNVAGPSHTKPKADNLITRYNLQDRVALATGSSLSTPEAAGGKAVWEDSAQKREASLRERKAKMVLAARERLLAGQAVQASST